MLMQQLFLLIFFLLLLLPYTDHLRRPAVKKPIKNPNEVALRKLMKMTKNKMKDPTKNTPKQNGIATVTEAKLICKFKKTIISNVPKKHKEEIARSLLKCCSEKGMTPEKLANCQGTILNFANVMKHDPKIANARKAYLSKQKNKVKRKKVKGRNKRSWDYSLFLKRVKRMALMKNSSISTVKRKIASKFPKRAYGKHLIELTFRSSNQWTELKSRNGRKKRGIGEGLIAAVLILAGIWFSYLALVCFFSILIPPFIFAMLLTVIFGGIAWFCVKAADAILDSSVENDYGSIEGKFEGYDDFEHYGEYEGFDDFDGYGRQSGGPTHFGEGGFYDPHFVDLENGFYHNTNYGPDGITSNTGYSQVGGKGRKMGGFQGR